MKTIKAPYSVDGGIHPQYHKELSKDNTIEVMPISHLLHVSMSQHLGAPANPLVKKGDTVLRGQVIGEPAGFISAQVHAPTSGTVKNVAPATTATGQTAMCIDIEPDGNDTWAPEISERAIERAGLIKKLISNPDEHRKAVIEIIAECGIAGMGGAGFPTHVKLSPPPDKNIDTVIINGAECEPYLTSDNRLMIEHADQIWEGCKIIRAILGAKRLMIAIEDNKPEAIATMEKAVGNDDPDADTSIVILKTEYPQGAEKQMIYNLIGKEVPSGGLPMDVGAVVENVGTCMAIWDAVTNSRPLTERLTTVTGTPLSSPKNVLARVGTSYSDLIAFCGGESGKVAKIISGGPMMGFAQTSFDVATTKTTSGLLLLAPAEISTYSSMPCISCGRCVDGCPMNLMPCELSQMLEAEDYEAAEEYNVMDCIECGCCAFQCPAHRPLVQHMRQGKAVVSAKRRAKK
ncbi:MAG: electron transport complex subunit RsxC [Kiritimatiellae bacterium]|nr:electron transport complex subunit RsxC [Kiritimatiellia bacterium]